MQKNIHHLPFMQIVKDGRAYILLLPFNSEFEECKAVLQEFDQQLEQERAFRLNMAEQAQLQQEAVNAKAEAAQEAGNVTT